MYDRKLVKSAKPAAAPLIIGASGVTNPERREEAPAQNYGGVIIGSKGVVKSSVQPRRDGSAESYPQRDRGYQQEIPSSSYQQPSSHQQQHSSGMSGAGNSGMDPNTVRTIRMDKMAEENMAKATQMLEEADEKLKYANQQLEEAQIKAKEIFKEQQAKGNAFLENTKRYCEELQANAEREGFEQGKALGMEAGKQEAGALMQQAMNVINHVVQERDVFFQQIEPKLAELSIQIAERIINTEVTLNNDIVLNLIKNNLDKVKDREEIIVRVSPDDCDFVKENQDVLRKMLEGTKKFRIEADRMIEKGGCMIETNLGNLDARVDCQLEVLKLAFEQCKAAD